MALRNTQSYRSNNEEWNRFDDVYNATFSSVYAYCVRRTRSRADTDDAVSDTFLVAWRRRNELFAADHPVAWLYGVARRVLANQRKATERRNRTEERATGFASLTASDNPARDAEHRVQLGSVLDAMATLDDRDQELLLLAAFEQLSHAEMAIVVGARAETIKSRLYRARVRLQEQLMAREGSRRHA